MRALKSKIVRGCKLRLAALAVGASLSFASPFAAAGMLHKRYGWEIGIPAHAVAAFVGIARVKANKHYIHDVVAGAAVGEAAAWLIARRKSDKVQWLPWGDTHGAGVSVVIRN